MRQTEVKGVGVSRMILRTMFITAILVGVSSVNAVGLGYRSSGWSSSSWSSPGLASGCGTGINCSTSRSVISGSMSGFDGIGSGVLEAFGRGGVGSGKVGGRATMHIVHDDGSRAISVSRTKGFGSSISRISSSSINRSGGASGGNMLSFSTGAVKSSKDPGIQIVDLMNKHKDFSVWDHEESPDFHMDTQNLGSAMGINGLVTQIVDGVMNKFEGSSVSDDGNSNSRIDIHNFGSSKSNKGLGIQILDLTNNKGPSNRHDGINDSQMGTYNLGSGKGKKGLGIQVVDLTDKRKASLNRDDGIHDSQIDTHNLTGSGKGKKDLEIQIVDLTDKHKASLNRDDGIHDSRMDTQNLGSAKGNKGLDIHVVDLTNKHKESSVWDKGTQDSRIDTHNFGSGIPKKSLGTLIVELSNKHKASSVWDDDDRHDSLDSAHNHAQNMVSNHWDGCATSTPWNGGSGTRFSHFADEDDDEENDDYDDYDSKFEGGKKSDYEFDVDEGSERGVSEHPIFRGFGANLKNMDGIGEHLINFTGAADLYPSSKGGDGTIIGGWGFKSENRSPQKQISLLDGMSLITTSKDKKQRVFDSSNENGYMLPNSVIDAVQDLIEDHSIFYVTFACQPKVGKYLCKLQCAKRDEDLTGSCETGYCNCMLREEKKLKKKMNKQFRAAMEGYKTDCGNRKQAKQCKRFCKALTPDKKFTGRCENHHCKCVTYPRTPGKKKNACTKAIKKLKKLEEEALDSLGLKPETGSSYDEKATAATDLALQKLTSSHSVDGCTEEDIQKLRRILSNLAQNLVYAQRQPASGASVPARSPHHTSVKTTFSAYAGRSSPKGGA